MQTQIITPNNINTLTTFSVITEEQHARGTLIQVIFLTFNLFSAFILHKLHSKWFSPSAASIVIGLIAGIFVRYVANSDYIRIITNFDSISFFLFILPPIIFEAGLSVNKKAFFHNVGSIMLLALLGVVINTAIFGGLLYAVSVLDWMTPHLSLLECLMFGSIISATDPVTVLAVFGELKVDVNLYSNVFGESVLNDAVAIVLFKSLVRFQNAPLTVNAVFASIGQFTYIFAGSFGVGVASALLIALILKYTDFENFSQIELGIILTSAYGSYLVADALGLSGIVSVLFCGIFFAHYAEPNLQGSTIFSQSLFGLFAFIAETLAFQSLGIGLWSETSLSWSLSVIGWSFLFVLIARAVMVFPLCEAVNCFRKSLPIPRSHQVIIWHAGLRGVIAFAITSQLTVPHATIIQTAVAAIILGSILVLGGTTVWLLDTMNIERGVSQRAREDQVDPVWLQTLEQYDRRWFRPLFSGQMFRKTQTKSEEETIQTVTSVELH